MVNGGRNNEAIGQLELLALSSRQSRSHRGRLTMQRYHEEGETHYERERMRDRRLDITRWGDRRLSRCREDRSLIASPMTVPQVSLGAVGKVMVATAVEIEDPTGFGRCCRMQVIPNASAVTLGALIRTNIEPGSVALTDGLISYPTALGADYTHKVFKIAASGKKAHENLRSAPRGQPDQAVAAGDIPRVSPVGTPPGQLRRVLPPVQPTKL